MKFKSVAKSPDVENEKNFQFESLSNTVLSDKIEETILQDQFILATETVSKRGES